MQAANFAKLPAPASLAHFDLSQWCEVNARSEREIILSTLTPSGGRS